jgi:DNA-directed RNA polymerase subunit RPC12/RpoP
MKMKEREYQCDGCGNIFIADWSESDALKEKESNGWGDMDHKTMARVCDDCYLKIMKFNDHEPGEMKGE